MVGTNIQDLANEINISVEKLIQKCCKVGIIKTENDIVSQSEKIILLQYLNKQSFILKDNVLTLKRKIRSTLNIFSSRGKNKCVSIEIRKNKKYFKNNNINILSTQEKQKNLKKNNHIKNLKNNNKELNNHISKKSKENVNCNSIVSQKLNEYVYKSKTQNIDCTEVKHNLNHIMNTKKELQKKVNFKNTVLQVNKEKKIKLNNRIKSIERYKNCKTSNEITSKFTNKNSNNIKEFYHTSNKNLTRNNYDDNHYKKYTNYEHTKIVHSNTNNITNKKNSFLKQEFKKPLSIINRKIILNDSISISDLANKMAIKGSEIIRVMMKLGYTVTINHIIERDVAQLVAEEMGHKVTIYSENELEQKIMQDRDFGDGMEKLRPPIVTIMGHVDHGKTSLLDKIKLTKIVDSEFGGITQHIGAYHVKINKKTITFLDTPGHSAFTAMRARGAQVTDIIILVIAADDGVKPQTIEAIQHAQAASVPILVAINKIDKLTSNIEKIKNELTKYNILPEEWGGDNIFVNISAKSGKGIENLLHAIVMQSEMLELKAMSEGMASGLVLESSIDKGKGPTATILIKEGRLCKGNVVLCGFEYGRIRAMQDDLGNEIQSAGPSFPVKILGLSGIPVSGDKIFVVRSEKKAREVALYRKIKYKENKISQQKKLKLSDVFESIKHKDISEINIIIKSDFHGSLEAISYSLLKLSNNNIKINIIGKGVGGVTETDALLAIASNAIIIGFNVRADSSAKRIIKSEKIDFRYYSIIYQIIEELKIFMSNLLSPKYKKEIIGLAKVRNIFKSPKFGVISGCIVIEGMIKRNSFVRVLRNNITIYTGELASLRRFKEDAQEVRSGVECGIGIKNYNDICIGDVIEAFQTIEIKK